MMLNHDKELTLEELEEIIAPSNEPKQSKQDEEKKEPVKPDISSKTINKIFSLTNQLTERITRLSQELFLRQTHALKFKRGIQKLLLVLYKGVRKDMANKKKQTSITKFCIFPNMG